MVYKAAVVQAGAVPFDKDKSVAKACQLILEAGRVGARLIVFPEAFISGYPKGCHFATPVGYRGEGARDEFLTYQAGCITIPGPETEHLGDAAREAGAYVVIGVMERGESTIYCTSLFIGPDGAVLGKHRKLMPTAAERLIWGFGDGSTLPVLETEIGRIGSVICWENFMPALRMAMYAQGIGLYCVPTADDRPVWPSSMRHIALEGRCFVLSACQSIKRGAYPADYRCALGDDPDTVLMRGGSMIVNPLGEILAGPAEEGETILYADIDLNDLAKGKFDLDTVGHYARPDIFSLTVNRRPMPAVRFSDGSDA
ncbi:MAG: carbon-nitrogen hydrolase family protein [Candidimonas sp.]|nr:MAG: carbon-nitrogen hydrolase family protein [Candidimonas sp.]